MAEDAPVTLNRTERVLAVIIATIVGLTIIAIAALLIGGAVGADRKEGVWPVVATIPLIGLPIAFLLIVAFLIATTVRRRRLAQDAGR